MLRFRRNSWALHSPKSVPLVFAITLVAVLAYVAQSPTAHWLTAAECAFTCGMIFLHRKSTPAAIFLGIMLAIQALLIVPEGPKEAVGFAVLILFAICLPVSFLESGQRQY